MITTQPPRPYAEIPRKRIDAVIRELSARVYEAEWVGDDSLAEYLRDIVERLEFHIELGETYIVDF